MDTATLVAFAAASLLLLVVPGPAVTFVLARSIQGGRRIGLASVAGLHLGTAVHIAASVVGLSALLVSSATAFTAVRWAGGLYLIYLGVRALRDKPVESNVAEPRRAATSATAFREGVVVNVLNPKLAVFFLAYLPQFTSGGSGAVSGQLLLLGGVFLVLGLITDGMYALAAAEAGRRFGEHTWVMRHRNRISGVTYIGLGALALATPNRTDA